MEDDMNRKEKIIDVAKKLIGHYGFRKTTMEDIARSAGLAKATLYHYFTSKEDILRAIINQEGEILRKKLQDVINKDISAEDKIREYTYTRFHYLQKLALYYKTLSEEYYSQIPFIEQERRRFDLFELDMIEQILREGIDQGKFEIPDPRLYAYILLQAVKALEVPLATGQALKMDGKPLDLDDVLDLLLKILIRGIGKTNSR